MNPTSFNSKNYFSTFLPNIETTGSFLYDNALTIGFVATVALLGCVAVSNAKLRESHEKQSKQHTTLQENYASLKTTQESLTTARDQLKEELENLKRQHSQCLNHPDTVEKISTLLNGQREMQELIKNLTQHLQTSSLPIVPRIPSIQSLNISSHSRNSSISSVIGQGDHIQGTIVGQLPGPSGNQSISRFLLGQNHTNNLISLKHTQ